MQRINTSSVSACLLGVLLAGVCFIFAACTYEVPITAGATRKVDARLLGDWVSSDGKDKFMVRKLDDSSYVVSDNGDLFRAYHSDVGTTPFVSVQHLEVTDRKYAYVAWKLSPDGRKLRLQAVSPKVVPKTIKNSTEIRRLLEKNRQNPGLLGEELTLAKMN